MTSKLWTNPEALRRSLDPERHFVSTLGEGRIDIGMDNLDVVLLHAPNVADLQLSSALGAAAHAGAFIDVKKAIETGEGVEAINLEGIGLEQVLEGETVTFLVYGCSRGFTHEIVRTRKGAWFLQQTMRHCDMGNANVRCPQNIFDDDTAFGDWHSSVKDSVGTYQRLLEQDIPYEDARTALPLGTETWIIVGMPLRTWFETYEYRACLTGESVVHTLAGDKTMRQLNLGLQERFDVYSVNAEGKLAIGKAHRPRSMGEKLVVKIRFDTGDELRLTADHRVMLRDGSYREAGQLQPGDSVMPFNRQLINGYPIVFRDIETAPIAAHKFTVTEKRGIVTKPYRFGDIRQMVVHHRDFDKMNNSDDNLDVMTSADHIALHAAIGGHVPTEEERAAASKRMRENNPMRDPEVAAKAAARMREWRTEHPEFAKAAATRASGNQRAKGKGRSTGGKVGGTFGHVVPANGGQFQEKQHPWNAGLSKETDPRLATMGNRVNHNHKVLSVEPDGAEEVFDMHVEDHHNFAAQTVFVHNCHMFYPEMRFVWARMKEELALKVPSLAAQARITCEKTHTCTYRGAEDTITCPIYPGSRQWRSPLYDRASLERFAALKVKS